jgi:hypothetical protein
MVSGSKVVSSEMVTTRHYPLTINHLISNRFFQLLFIVFILAGAFQ